ncbi:unnamed protein product [Parajaminaea phylloscopi]
MPPAVDPVIVQALQRACPYLGSSFEPAGASKIWATAPKEGPRRLLMAKCQGPVKNIIGEASSLEALQAACVKAASAGSVGEVDELIVPRLHAFGEAGDGKRAYLVTDWVEAEGSGSATAQHTLGQKFAQIHKAGVSPNGKFGFHVPTHCGATELDNSWSDTWAEFYAEKRIGDMVRRIGDSQITALEAKLRTLVYPLLLDTLGPVQPVIQHGDAWSGNVAWTASGSGILFDACSWYGHNEADLGITHCFGGFSKAFYDGYHSVLPKAEPAEFYDERIELYKLFHWLNHTLMFGGAYKGTAMRSAQKLIDWAEKRSGQAGSAAKHRREAEL